MYSIKPWQAMDTVMTISKFVCAAGRFCWTTALRSRNEKAARVDLSFSPILSAAKKNTYGSKYRTLTVFSNKLKNLRADWITTKGTGRTMRLLRKWVASLRREVLISKKSCEGVKFS